MAESNNSSLFRFVSNSTCESLLPWSPLVSRLGRAMAAFSRGNEVTQPVRTVMKMEKGFYGMMPCFSSDENTISCKLLTVMPENAKLGKSTHIAHVCLFDATTGRIKALLEGDTITIRRTAATSALSAVHLYPKSNNNNSINLPRTLSILGAGHQGKAHLQVLTSIYPSIETVKLWNRSRDNALALKDEINNNNNNISVHETPADCVSDADLVVTATFSADPILRLDDVSKEDNNKPVHVMAVGSSRPDMAEIDPGLMLRARVFVDSRAGARVESGDVLRSRCEITAEIGEVVDDEKKKASSKSSLLTVYKSLGMAVQDLAAGQMVLEGIKEGDEGERMDVPIWREEEVSKAMAMIKEDEVEAVAVEAVAGVSSGKVELRLRASQKGKLLLCEVETIINKDGDNCGGKSCRCRCSLVLVYTSDTGELLGVADGAGLLRGEKKNGFKNAVMTRLIEGGSRRH